MPFDQMFQENSMGRVVKRREKLSPHQILETELNRKRAARRKREETEVARLLNWGELDKRGYGYRRDLAEDTDLSIGKVRNIIKKLRARGNE